MDLNANSCAVTKKIGSGYGYTNSNYQYTNQVRTGNGRIFFAEYNGIVSYYDPISESIKDIGVVTTDPVIYKFASSLDGLLYAGTQSKGVTPPSIISD